MPWRKAIQLGGLLVIGLALAALNLWFAAQRSTIPLQLNDRVVSRELRREKHPGHDDVLLLKLNNSGELQVDAAIFKEVAESDQLRKAAWSKSLQINDHTISLDWSRDTSGMLVAMPLLLLILLLAAIWSLGIRVNPPDA